MSEPRFDEAALDAGTLIQERAYCRHCGGKEVKQHRGLKNADGTSTQWYKCLDRACGRRSVFTVVRSREDL